MKPRSDTWQGCVAVERALEDIEKPLVETYQNTVEQYETTKAQLASAAKWLSGRRSWPPTSVSVEAEIKEFSNIETQWQELESQPNRAIAVVRRLSELSTKLQSLAERAGQKAARAEQEQSRIQDLEGELAELTRRWQALGQEYPEAVGEIRGLNAQIGREVEGLKRQYRQGSIAYSQILQSLNLLCQNVQNEQINLSNGQTLRLDGNGYHRRR
jgi:chromosome segregation ATPase